MTTAMSFTLFVILPLEDVCTLRDLPTGTSVGGVRQRLELTAGLPAQTYTLSLSDGQAVADDVQLRLGHNVWDGFVVRAVFRDNWRNLWGAVVAGDVDRVVRLGGLHMLNRRMRAKGDEDIIEARERGVVALFVASFLGMHSVCQTLLRLGVSADGQTPFGRTALFAAMSRDHVHVIQLLLTNNASLQIRDVDGVTAVDCARGSGAKESLRKVRHGLLYRTSHSASSATRTWSSPAGGRRQHKKDETHLTVRVPTDADAEDVAQSPVRGKHPVLRWCESDDSNETSLDLSLRLDFNGGKNSQFNAQRHSENGLKGEQTNGRKDRFSGSTWAREIPATKRELPEGVLYSWEDNLQPLRRAASAAGTCCPMPILCNSRDKISSGRRSGAGKVTWRDTTPSPGRTGRLTQCRPAVQDVAIRGPESILTVSSPCSPNIRPVSGAYRNRERNVPIKDASSTTNTPTTATIDNNNNHDVDSSVPRNINTDQDQAAGEVCSGPGQQLAAVIAGQGSHPSRSTDRENASPYLSDHQPRDDAVGGPSRSPLVVSLGADPITRRGEGSREGDGISNHGDNEKNRDHVPATSKQVTRSPHTARPIRSQLARHKQRASLQKMKKRLHLAEQQKRQETAHTKLQAAKEGREISFNQWLQRKRKESRRQGDSDSDTSSSDSEQEEVRARIRSAKNTRAFNDWLKDLKERPRRGPFPFTVASLHRRKSRPLKNLFQIGVSPEEASYPADVASYLTAYRQWRKETGCSDNTTLPISAHNIKDVARQLEEKRKSMLTMALTYEDWMEHMEERQQLAKALVRADASKVEGTEDAQHEWRRRRAPRQISYQQWRQRVDKQNRERQRLIEMDQQGNGLENTRSSLAIAHEEWLKRKTEDLMKAKRKETSKQGQRNGDGRGGKQRDTNISEDDKQKYSAWEVWLERTHRKEVAQLDQQLNQERQLSAAFIRRKQPAMTSDLGTVG